MKTFVFNRKRLLRAIHAACVALFLAASAAAHAQMATADGNGNVSITGSGTDYTYNGTNPPLASGGTLTVSATSTITNTANPIVINIAVGATIANHGTLSATYNGTDVNVAAAIFSIGGTAPTTITNSGSLSAIDMPDSTTAAGIYYANSGAAAVTITNSGSSYGGATHGYGAYASTGGNGNITNSGALLAGGANAFGASLTAGGTGTFSNTGTIVVNGGTGAGVVASTVGNLTETNSGGVTVTSGNGLAVGLDASSFGGSVVVTNAATGTISVTANGNNFFNSNVYGIRSVAEVSSTDTIINHGSISAVSNVAATSAAAILAEPQTTGDISITNTGTLSGQATNNSYGIDVQNGGGTGTVTINNSGVVTATGSGNYTQTTAIYAASAGDILLQSTGTSSISAVQGDSSTAVVTGISLTTTAGNIVVHNTSAPISASGYYTAKGISATTATGGVTITNGGAVTGISTTTSGGEGAPAAPGFGIFANVTGGAGDISIGNTGSIVASTAYSNGAGLSSAAGLYGITSGTGNVTITNSGAIHATASSSAVQGDISASGVYAITQDGNGTITNTGASDITVLSTHSAYGLDVFVRGAGAASVTNTSTGQITVTDSNRYRTAGGILSASQYGTAFLSNSARVTASGGYTANSLSAYSSTGQTVVNTGALSASNSTYAFGIHAENIVSGTFSISNSGSITSSGYSAYGIYGRADGTSTLAVTNSGTLSVTGTGGNTNAGIYAFTNNTAVSVMNSAPINVQSQLSSYGIDASGSSVTIQNLAGGTATASTNDGESTAAGIYAVADSGGLDIENAGVAMGTNLTGQGYGIYANGTGPILVNNTGSAVGTTYGIYLGGAGTVNNSGLASGGTNSIFVPTGSTVNLNDASPVSGLLKGGTDDTSSSVLNFNIKVRGNLAAAQSALDAAITAYAAALAMAPQGPGHDVDSEVVDINGIAYQWEDFADITDGLLQGRVYANTPGFHGLGAALDGLDTTTTQGGAILTALGNVDDAGVPSALSELSPKALELFRHVANDNTTFTDANVNNHLANLRDGLTGFDSTELTINDASLDPSLSQVKSRLLAFDPAATPGLINDSADTLFGGVDMKDMKATKVNTQPTNRWSAFISGNVILADLQNNVDLPDSNYTTGAVTAGADYRLDDHFTIGAVLSYAHTDADLDSRGSSATVDSYSPGIYGSYVNGGWYANAMAAYVRNAYTDDRNIDIPGLVGTNHGATSGNQATADFTGGYEFQRGSFKFGPVATLQYVHLAIQSIQEQGPTALDIAAQNTDSLRTLFGVEGRFEANVATCYGPMTLTPHLSVSWQHEYMDNSDGITSQFDGAGGGSFTVQTDQVDRDSAFIDVGLDATVSKNVTVFVDYQTQVGQNNFDAQSAQGGVRVGF